MALNEDQIIKVLEKHSISPEDVLEVVIAKPEFNGENVCSVVFTVRVRLRNGQVVEMFAKTLVQNPKYRKDIQEMKLFEREAAFFQQIVPELEAFVGRVTRGEEKPKYELDILPKCYYGDENLILLENLNTKGYVMLDKFKKHDMRHASAVLDTMAKLHAPSYTMMKTEISGRSMLEKYPILTHLWSLKEGEKSMRPMIESWVHTAISILEQGLTEDWEYGLGFLETLKCNPYEAMMKNAKAGDLDGKFLCINHGDSWNNNILFKESGSGGELDVKLIDFQLPNVGSLVLDISTYIFASVESDVDAGWRTCLKIYYERFNEYVRILGGRVDFTEEELEEEFKRRYLLGFLIGIAMIVAMEAFDCIQSLEELEGNFSELLEDATKKWLRDNPGEAVNLSRKLVNLFQVHKEFCQ